VPNIKKKFQSVNLSRKKRRRVKLILKITANILNNLLELLMMKTKRSRNQEREQELMRVLSKEELKPKIR